MHSFTAAISLATVVSVAFAQPLSNSMHVGRESLLSRGAEVVDIVPSEVHDSCVALNNDFSAYYQKPYGCNNELLQNFFQGDIKRLFSLAYPIDTCAKDCLWNDACNSYSYSVPLEIDDAEELEPQCLMFSEDKDTAQEIYPNLIIVDPRTCDIQETKLSSSLLD